MAAESPVLIFGRHWSPHRSWFVLTLIALVAMAVLYALAAVAAHELPGGASLVGFAFGVVGGAIILFECFLWARKKYLRSWRLGRTQTWMRAHIWLGLWTVPLLVLHSGFHWGGTLSTVLLALLLIVVASGIWGLFLQQWLPRRMLDEAPAETIYGQIDHVVRSLADDAERLVLATCGSEEEGHTTRHQEAEVAEQAAKGFLTIGAVRSAGRVHGRVLATVVPTAPIAETEALRAFFHETIQPFLRAGLVASSPLRYTSRAAALFQDLQARLPATAHPAARALQSICDQRRQLAEQARLQWWLHSWLWVHLPLSASLLLLMLVHIFVALKYW
jgi:hypothetical protein